MIHGLEWTEPVAVRQWQWQTQGLPQIKNLFGLFAKWSLLLGIPALLILYRVAPTELPRTASVFLAILQSLQVGVQLSANRKDGVRYSVEGKGLRRCASGGTVLYQWKNIESYRFVKHPHISGIGVLELKMRRSRRVHQWSFNPSRVSEQELSRAMQRHLPARTLQSFSTRTSQQGA
jgi:hypothetical protein